MFSCVLQEGILRIPCEPGLRAAKMFLASGFGHLLEGLPLMGFYPLPQVSG